MDLCPAVLVRSLGQALTGYVDQEANASDREQSETATGEIGFKRHGVVSWVCVVWNGRNLGGFFRCGFVDLSDRFRRVLDDLS